MAYEEKRAWIYAAIAASLTVVYFAAILSQLASTEASEIAYVRPMLAAIGGAIVLNILLTIIAGILAPGDHDNRDERDASIDRYGEYLAGIVLGVTMVVPFGLTLAGANHFWVAQGMYLAFVLSALSAAILKIIAYRRGF